MTFRLSAIVLLISAAPALGQDRGGSPEPAAIAAAGRASVARFGREIAAWTSATQAPNGVQFLVDVIQTPTMKRSALSIAVKGQREELVRVISRDGFWYVTQGKKIGKYRPFEAPLDMPTGYLYLNRCDPGFLTEEPRAARLGTFERMRDEFAVYRSPLPDAAKQQLASTIAEYDRFVKENPGKTLDPATVRSVAESRDLLEKGLATEIDVASGMLVQYGAPERRTRIIGFRWLASADPNEFAIANRNWVDYSDDPTQGDLDDLVMIGHCAVWQPGMRASDTDGRLLELKTGRFRRIPFVGELTMPGCFAKDRTRVIVTGLDADRGAHGLYEIDLKTGANRPLGGELFSTGVALFPTLSPDGKSVALLHKGTTGRILEAQICLVDLQTGAGRKVGSPRDTGPPAWHPDGKALIVVDRQIIDVSKPSIDTICRIELDGRVTKLRKGRSPIIVGNGKNILFEDAETRTWQTCDLDGKNDQVYAGGMSGHAFPAVSPTGDRLLMMRFQKGKAPEPVVFPFGNSAGTAATAEPGLWTNPAWR